MLALVVGLAMAGLAAVVVTGGSGAIAAKTPWGIDETPASLLVPARDPALAAEMTALRATLHALTERVEKLEAGTRRGREPTGGTEPETGPAPISPGTAADPLVDRIAALEAALARAGTATTFATSVPPGASAQEIKTRMGVLDPALPGFEKMHRMSPMQGPSLSAEQRTLLERLVREYPNDPDAPLALANLVWQFLVEFRPDLARDALDRHAPQVTFPSVELERLYARVHGEGGDPVKERAALERALASGRGSEFEQATCRLGIARALVREKRYDEARRQFRAEADRYRRHPEEPLQGLAALAANGVISAFLTERRVADARAEWTRLGSETAQDEESGWYQQSLRFQLGVWSHQLDEAERREKAAAAGK